MSDKLYTIHEASDYLKVHWQTVRNYIKSGKLKAIKIGKNVRIRESDLLAFAEGRSRKIETFEVEVRFFIDNRSTIEKKLIEHGAKVTGHSHIIDHWFVPLHVNSIEHNKIHYEAEGGSGIRIRELDEDYSGRIMTTLEAKKLANPPDHSICIEEELVVEAYDDAKTFLQLVGLKEFLTIDKDRTIYSYKDFKIVIDEIKDVGTGLEIELKTTNKDDDSWNRVLDFSRQIGINPETQRIKTSTTRIAMKTLARF